jgi:hypothetical protein
MSKQGLDGQAPPTIDAIHWRHRVPIGMGGYAMVYHVAPGLVAKVGRIDLEEVEVQRDFATCGHALPVYDYRAQVDLPQIVTREVCPRHGPRRDILPDGQDCLCGEWLDVLLMPEADVTEIDSTNPVIKAFMDAITAECLTRHERAWDARPSNVAWYHDRLVALDFGEESA